MQGLSPVSGTFALPPECFLESRGQQGGQVMGNLEPGVPGGLGSKDSAGC